MRTEDRPATSYTSCSAWRGYSSSSSQRPPRRWSSDLRDTGGFSRISVLSAGIFAGFAARGHSLEHLRGRPWARIGELVGQRNLAVTANTYTHVLVDETEIDYAALLSS